MAGAEDQSTHHNDNTSIHDDAHQNPVKVFIDCKNPGHKDFFTVDKFQIIDEEENREDLSTYRPMEDIGRSLYRIADEIQREDHTLTNDIQALLRANHGKTYFLRKPDLWKMYCWKLIDEMALISLSPRRYLYLEESYAWFIYIGLTLNALPGLFVILKRLMCWNVGNTRRKSPEIMSEVEDVPFLLGVTPKSGFVRSHDDRLRSVGHNDDVTYTSSKKKNRFDPVTDKKGVGGNKGADSGKKKNEGGTSVDDEKKLMDNKNKIMSEVEDVPFRLGFTPKSGFVRSHDDRLRSLGHNDDVTSSKKKNRFGPVTDKKGVGGNKEADSGKKKNEGGTSVDDEKKLMDNKYKSTISSVTDKVDFGARGDNNAAKLSAAPFLSGMVLRDILRDVENKRVRGSGISASSTSPHNSSEETQKDHYSSINDTLSRGVWGTHHGDIFHGTCQESTSRGFQDCTKHPGHIEFKTVDIVEDNPRREIFEFEEDKPRLWKLINRTVRVVVSHTSIERPDTYMNSNNPYPCRELRGNYSRIRYGTGFLHERYGFDVIEPCPCPECKTVPSSYQTQNRESYYFVIKTATHVIFDRNEAQNARFEFGYDSREVFSRVKKAYGVTVLDPDGNKLETDRCYVLCVTHHVSLAEKLDLLCGQIENTNSWFLVSHPHGESKRISVDHRTCFLPCGLFLIMSNKTSCTLTKGIKIRFANIHPDHGFEQVRVIQNLLRDDVIELAHSDGHDTYVLLCDVTIDNPEGIVLETGREFWKLYDNIQEKMWFRLSLGTQLITADGTRYTFSRQCDGGHTACMAVFGHIQSFLNSNDKDNLKIFLRSEYKMASCPGSSGAHVDLLGNMHFGTSNVSHNGISTLTCVYEPRHSVQDHQAVEARDSWRSGSDCFSLKDLVDKLFN